MYRLPLALLLTAVAAAQENVLMVLLDDVGVDMVGCYSEGEIPATTPVINGLAKEGVLFRNAWSNPCCSPTRATILTGRYGFRTGIGFVVSKGGHDLPLSELTLPEVFAGTNHSNAGFGKWHLANMTGNDQHHHPNLSGFDHWVGNYHNLKQPQNYEWWMKTTNGVMVFTDEYATSATVDAFLEWQEDQTGPWFAYLAFHAAHEPWHAPPGNLHTEFLPPVSPRLRPRPFYRAAIEAADMELGRLLAGLGPLLDQTNVVVVGDNGTPRTVSLPPFESSHAKLTPYEGGINVPLIVTGPAVRRGNVECQALVNTTDLFTTSLELAGYDPAQVLPPGHTHDSISLAPYLVDVNHPPLREWVYSEIWKPNGFGPKNLDHRMLRDDRYKIIRSGTDMYQMYDLELDPFELVNIVERAGGMTDEEQARFDALVVALDALLASG